MIARHRIGVIRKEERVRKSWLQLGTRESKTAINSANLEHGERPTCMMPRPDRVIRPGAAAFHTDGTCLGLQGTDV